MPLAKRFLIIVFVLFYSVAAFGDKTEKQVAIASKTGTQVAINTKASRIEWSGEKKISSKGHKGTIEIKKGTVDLDAQMNPVGGHIIIDMTTIECTDLSGKDMKKLLNHLSSDDFFDVANHKEASFKFTKVETLKNDFYNITGILTIRGQSHKEIFKIKIKMPGNTETVAGKGIVSEKNTVKKKKQKWLLLATGQLRFDRTKYGVHYNSESSVLKKTISIPKDKIIRDLIQLTFRIETEEISKNRH